MAKVEKINIENGTSQDEKRKFWNNDMEAIIGIMVVLLILGTINVFSSSFILAEAEFDTPYFFLKRHIINIFIGFIGFLICFRIDYHKWRNFMSIIFIMTIIALILVLIIGPQVNGAKRWLPLGITQFQPAELAKLIAIMITSAELALRVKLNQEINIFTPPMGFVALMAFLTEQEPDLGTAAIILGIPLIMLGVAGLSKEKILKLLGVVFAGVVLLIFRQPYRLERLKVTYDPWSDAQNYGYQTVQSLSAIGSGELTGMGLGVGVSKYDYLPEAHTDFAFAIFCQENGFLGAIFVFLLFAAFAIYAARVAAKAKDEFGQMLATGIMILVVGQAIANLLMVGGVLPVVGVPLPFISYGGTALIITMSAIGILVNIGRIGEKE